MAQRRRPLADTSPMAESEQAMGSLSSAVTTGSEALIDTQAELLERFDEISRGWLQRRREALEATRHSFEEMRACRNVTDMLRIQQDWVSGSLQRVASDFEVMTAMFLSYPRRAMTRFGDTVRSLGEDARSASESALSAAGAKPVRVARDED
jgi:hypothetical protein